MNTSLKGDVLENAIFDYFKTQISEGLFPCKSEYCKIFNGKGYFSKDRDGDIKFDVSIEFYLPGANDYSQVWLIECKNYSGTVPVDDVEEFFTKVQQVAAANCKAIMASRSSFASGGVNFARSKHMGLMRFFDSSDVKWELYRSPATMQATEIGKSTEIFQGLTSHDFVSNVFDFYMQGYECTTNSLWEFANSMLADSTITEDQRKLMRSSRISPSRTVPYITLHELENRSLSVLREIGYRNGAVSLEDLCTSEKDRCGLTVARIGKEQNPLDCTPRLGRISFSSLEILIYEQDIPNLGRERFTLAHELAHHLLCHGEYLSGESCDERDFVLRRDAETLGPDVARMEYQANIFASCLLMPRAGFIGNFRRIAEWLDIPRKNFGELFLDNQSCNYENYERVTGELMKFYGVSRTAASIRLESLGLLRDARSEDVVHFT